MHLRTPGDAVAAAFREHRRLVWMLCYRMTGSTADADDLVQETFAKAIASPPSDLDAPLRPWLVRVAMNLARDQLRRRRRARYQGEWLPAPIQDEGREDADLPAAHEPIETAARYDLMESVTMAFLIALEALSPPQRAVLILRDVFDYSVAETAEALAMSQANVKTTHHRARRGMETYDRKRCRPSPGLTARTQAVLLRFLHAMRTQDIAAVEGLLAADVVAVSDGGGDFQAVRRPLVGAHRVAVAYVRLTAQRRATNLRLDIRPLNGLPALIVEDAAPPSRWAPRWTLQIEIDDDDRIRAIHSVLAPAKLIGLDPIEHPA